MSEFDNSPSEQEIAAKSLAENPLADVRTTEGLSKEVDALIEALQPNQPEEAGIPEWKLRYSALVRFQTIITAGGALECNDFVNQLERLSARLNEQILDRRSSMSKEACNTLTILFKAIYNTDSNDPKSSTLRDQPIANYFLPTLFKILPVSIKVISESGHKCVMSIIENSSMRNCAAYLPLFVTGTTDKHHVVRLRCTEYVGAVLERKSAKKIHANDTYEFSNTEIASIEDTIKTKLSDANAEVRNAAKRGFLAYKNSYADRAETFINSLDSSLQKTLQQESSKQGSASYSLASRHRPTSSFAAMRKQFQAQQQQQQQQQPAPEEISSAPSQTIPSTTTAAATTTTETTTTARPTVEQVPSSTDIQPKRAASGFMKAGREQKDKQQLAIVTAIASITTTTPPTTPLTMLTIMTPEKSAVEQGPCTPHNPHQQIGIATTTPTITATVASPTTPTAVAAAVFSTVTPAPTPTNMTPPGAINKTRTATQTTGAVDKENQEPLLVSGKFVTADAKKKTTRTMTRHRSSTAALMATALRHRRNISSKRTYEITVPTPVKNRVASNMKNGTQTPLAKRLRQRIRLAANSESKV